MDNWTRDVRFALRQLRRNPGFTAVAVLTLGVGIGSATAVFNAAEVALHRPLPFEHEDRLTRIYRVPEAGTPRISLRPATFQAVERRGHFFDRIVGQLYMSFVHPTDAGPERVIGIGVTAGWAETLGVRPHLGRVFSPEEERLGSESDVVLLSYGAWQRRFGGDEGVVGREIVLDGRARTIVGVMQRGLHYPYSSELWVPMRADAPQAGPWSYNVQARLRPGVSVEAAREELAAIGREAAASGEAPALQAEGMTLVAIPLRETLVGDEGRASLLLLGAVGFLLLIVCANLANLLLAKGLSREREFAVRASLGASRAQLVRQLLTESFVLGGAGISLGIALAHIGSGLARPLLPGDFAYFEASVTMNGAVLGFAVGVALVTTLLFGLLPALRLSGLWSPSGLLRTKGGSGGAGGRRLSRSLVVAEIALGVVLLTGAGVVAQDLRRLATADPGYDPASLLTAAVSLSQGPYTEPSTRVDFVSRAVAELSARPGVAAAGATTMFPTDGGNALAQIEIEGREERPGTQILVNHRLVDPGFLGAVGVPVLAGRGITDADRAGSPPVVVVSASAARRFWPGEDPIGRRVRSVDGAEEWRTVVGVVGDVREFYDVEETWYLPFAQQANQRAASSVTFAVRGAGAGPPGGAAVRAALAGVAPDLPVVDLTTAREIHSASLERERQAAGLSGAFALFGLLLAAMGVYGSIAWAVNARRREFGIRMALGSDSGGILRGVLAEGMRMVALGAVLGTLGALAATEVMAGLLETVEGFDPLPFGVAVLVLVPSAALATFLPARRVAAVDPAEVLREE